MHDSRLDWDEFQLQTNLDSFMLKFDLDADGRQFMEQLSPDVQSVVIKEFDPRSDTNHVIGKLRKFASSIQNRLQTDIVVDTSSSSYAEITDFVHRWDLDSSATSFLAGLESAVRSKVMSEFDPKEGTNNVTGKLRVFAKTVAASMQSQLTGTAVQRGSRPFKPNEDNASPSAINDFCEKWNLEAEEDFMNSLPTHVAATIVEEFAPREDTKDVSGKLHAFAKTIQSGTSRRTGFASPRQPRGASWQPQQCDSMPPSQSRMSPGAAKNPDSLSANALRRFQDMWKLDIRCMDFIASLPSNVQGRIIAEFEPRDDTKDISGKCMVFARTVCAAQGISGGQPSWAAGAGSARGQPSWSAAAGAGWQASSGASYPRKQDSGSTGVPGIWNFLSRFALDSDAEAIAFMTTLPPPVRARVMQEFNPRSETYNCLAKLRSFAKSVASHVDAGIAPENRKRTREWEYELTGPSRDFRPMDGIAAFAMKWGIEAHAEEYVRGLSHEAQQVVIEQFEPHANTRDMTGRLITFARSIESGKGKGRGKAGKASYGMAVGHATMRGF